MKARNETLRERIDRHGWDEVVRVSELGACWEWRRAVHTGVSR